MTRSSGPCLCGDTECPRCGTAQGTLDPRPWEQDDEPSDEPSDERWRWQDSLTAACDLESRISAILDDEASRSLDDPADRLAVRDALVRGLT
jgi:hypothetical protein